MVEVAMGSAIIGVQNWASSQLDRVDSIDTSYRMIIIMQVETYQMTVVNVILGRKPGEKPKKIYQRTWNIEAKTRRYVLPVQHIYFSATLLSIM